MPPRRQISQWATRCVVLLSALALATQVFHLLRGDFVHPSRRHSEQPVAPQDPPLPESARRKIIGLGVSQKQPIPGNNLLQLSTNTHFNARSVRISRDPAAAAANTVSVNSRRYSHFRCVGDDNNPEGRRERICVFENVCYDTTNSQWTYHVRGNSSRKPVLFDATNGERLEFYESRQDYQVGFVALSGFTEGSTDWWPTISTSPSPAVLSPETTVVLDNLHALFHLAVHDDNLGHLLWEEMAALWYGMIRLNAFSDELVPMHMLGTLPDRKLNVKFRTAFMPAITPKDPVSFNDYMKKTVAKQRAATHVCFDQLMAGGNMLRFFQSHGWHNQGHEPLFYSLRNRILKHHGIDPEIVPKTHRIVFTNKTETLKKNIDGGLAKNRGIANLRELVQHVQTKYPDVDVQVVEWQKLSIKKQLDLMHSTTIFITPSGGVSTMLPFLPEGGHAIILDYFERKGEAYYGTQAGTSVSMEAPMWNHFPFIKKLYYQVWGSQDFVSDIPGKSVEDVDWRYEASVKVDFERMDKLIEAAFEDMEP
ncbi:hypothetical protein BJ741DRAFT_634421 [Chytriomyces cf. hyalinus JEL632]|nr:hypothetical protein BJ741DRAFT_634421 [Chytriomyces cf. hyalinus JEL632]